MHLELNRGIRNVAFPVEEKHIEMAEREINVLFPSSFRKKMMEMNGGEITLGDDCYHLFPLYDT